MNISGNEKRRLRTAARMFAVQALFQMETSGQTSRDVLIEFIDHRMGTPLEDGVDFRDGDVDHFRDVVETAVNYQARIDQATDAALVAKWPIARIDPTLRAVFRAAGGELTLPDMPPKVVIAEYIDIASAFSADAKETKFVNAVLDHMARGLRGDLSDLS